MRISKVLQRNLPARTNAKVKTFGSYATFLDLNVTISNGKISTNLKISTKLYNKRDYLSFVLSSHAKPS